MKKLLGVIGVSLLLITGCGTGSDADSKFDTTDTVDMSNQKEGDQVLIRTRWSATAKDDSEYMEYTREYTGENYHMEMLPLESGDKLTLDLSGEVPMNLVQVQDKNFAKILSNGLALDLRPYLNEFGGNITDKISDEAWATVTDPDTGAVYGIPTYKYKNTIESVTMYRKDILEKEGLEVPTNPDEIVSTVCTLADRGYKTPWAVNWSSWFWEYDMRNSYGIGTPWNRTDDGSVEYIGKDPRLVQFLDLGHQLYECGGLGTDYETIQQEDRDARFVNGDAVFISEAPFKADAQLEGMKTLGVDWYDAVGMTAGINGPDGTAGAEMEGDGDWTVTFIPTYMEDYAKQTIELVNKLYEDDYIMHIFFGTEGETFEYNEDNIPYRIPETELPWQEDLEVYGVGTPDTMLAESQEVYQDKIAEAIDNGETVDAGDYALNEALKYKDIGIIDPLAPTLMLSTWNDNADCANGKVMEFANLYVVGKKTKDDFAALGEDIDATCNFQSVEDEVKTWYDQYGV